MTVQHLGILLMYIEEVLLSQKRILLTADITQVLVETALNTEMKVIQSVMDMTSINILENTLDSARIAAIVLHLGK